MSYYFTRQISRAIETLTQDLRSSIREQAQALRDASDVAEKAGQEISMRLSDLRVSADERTEAKTDRNKAHRQQIILTWLNAFAFTAAAIYAGIAGCQLREMKKTNDLTRLALGGNGRALSATLAKMQGQIEQMSRLADNTGTQAIQTSKIAGTSQLEANATRSFADATIKDFQLDQRAWLEVRISSPSDRELVGSPAANRLGPNDEKVYSLITNSGKTPASDIVAAIATWTRFNPSSPEQAEARWFEKIIALVKEHKLDIPHDRASRVNIARDAPAVFWPPSRNFRDQIDVPELDNVGVIPPGDSGYELPPLESEFNFLSIVYGEITYKDIYGKGHTTRFCFMRHGNILRPRSRYEACDVFNSIN